MIVAPLNDSSKCQACCHVYVSLRELRQKTILFSWLELEKAELV